MIKKTYLVFSMRGALAVISLNGRGQELYFLHHAAHVRDWKCDLFCVGLAT